MYSVKLQNILCKHFPHMELLGIGHIYVEFIQNCVDLWSEFGIELESDLEVSNCTVRN